jgi:hypothetical protein
MQTTRHFSTSIPEVAWREISAYPVPLMFAAVVITAIMLPGRRGSMSGLFCDDFKLGLINLGAEVDEKSAVRLRDF